MQSLIRQATQRRCGLIVLMVALLVGCARPVAQESQVASPTATSTALASPTPTTEPTARPAAPAILRVDQGCGLEGLDACYARIPSFLLLGDGRVVLPAGPIDFYSGPVLPEMQVRQLTDAGEQAVLAAVEASGQLAADADWQGASVMVADAGSTTFTLNTDSERVRVSVYALGVVSTMEVPPNFPAAELPAYRALSQLLDELTTLDSWLPADAWAQPAWHPYTPNTIRLFARNADADLPDESGAVDERPWPAEGDTTWTEYPGNDWGRFRCRIASDDDVNAWYEALSGADGITRFLSAGHRYQVSVRPLLPGEAAECPESR